MLYEWPTADDPPPNDGGNAAGPTLAALAAAAAILLVTDAAHAIRFRIRTYSIGRATQTSTVRRGLANQQIFTQGLDLRAYDLTGQRTGDLNAVVDARYTTDFNLPQNRVDDPPFAHQWNNIALRLSYLEYQPGRAFRARLGRQWSRGTLGIRDFDGLRLTVRPRLEPGLRALLEGYGGRDVQVGLAPYNTDEFDVQGLPARNEGEFVGGVDATRWLAGGRLGMTFEDTGAIEFAYRRRWHGTGDDLRVGSERFGTALSMSPHPRITVAADAIYHSMLQGVDQAALDIAWNTPWLIDTLSFGLEHRHPWFDASSIWNIFGTRPHQGAYAVARKGVPALATDFELRGWGRLYRGSEARSRSARIGDADVARVGAALAHESAIYPYDHPVDWSSQISVEADTGLEESTHLLADTRLRSPMFFDDFYLSGRLLVLGVDGHDRSVASTVATTFVLGAEIPIRELGALSLTAERTVGWTIRATTELYGTLELEIWPG
ncbi:MAG: hypothetical protein ABEN55_14775 [Bradymonadaceae bacterium]